MPSNGMGNAWCVRQLSMTDVQSFKLHAVADAAESVLRIPGGFILEGASTQADAEVALVNVKRLANQIGQKRWFRFV